MKYIKLFEELGEKTLKEYIDNYYCSGSSSKYPDEKWLSFGCPNKKLIDLDGMEKFVNLEGLDCSRNLLKNLHGIENLIKLKRLKCYGNQLTNLKEIKNLINLEEIDFAKNQISNFEFGEFSIDAFELGIDVSDISRFKKLKFFDATHNNLSSRYSKYLKKYCKEHGINSWFGDEFVRVK